MLHLVITHATPTQYLGRKNLLVAKALTKYQSHRYFDFSILLRRCDLCRRVVRHVADRVIGLRCRRFFQPALPPQKGSQPFGIVGAQTNRTPARLKPHAAETP